MPSENTQKTSFENFFVPFSSELHVFDTYDFMFSNWVI